MGIPRRGITISRRKGRATYTQRYLYIKEYFFLFRTVLLRVSYKVQRETIWIFLRKVFFTSCVC
jgi:hypothetical protein